MLTLRLPVFPAGCPGLVLSAHNIALTGIDPRVAQILSNWGLESLTWVNWPGWLGPGQDVGPRRGHTIEKEATGGQLVTAVGMVGYFVAG